MRAEILYLSGSGFPPTFTLNDETPSSGFGINLVKKPIFMRDYQLGETIVPSPVSISYNSSGYLLQQLSDTIPDLHTPQSTSMAVYHLLLPLLLLKDQVRAVYLFYPVNFSE